jgi:hypothetical protein
MGNDPGHSASLILRYGKGDLIVKEGDYGISIYRIDRGSVLISQDKEGREVPLNTLGAGEVIGEMAFLNETAAPRAFSARTLEETEVEVFHPARLLKEYEQSPPMLKAITDQVLARLVRMNRIQRRLMDEREKNRGKSPEEVSEPSKRLFYRKEMNHPCTYRPIEAPEKMNLSANIRDISFTGVGLEVRGRNLGQFVHDKGEQYRIRTVLPNGKELEFMAKIVYMSKNIPLEGFFLGMEITEISQDSKKALGFFLMP